MEAAKSARCEVEKEKSTPAALAKYLGIVSADEYDHVFL
jgi:hypothetical protein